MANYASCAEVDSSCPIWATAVGYAPSLPANATLLVIFSLVAVVQLIQGAAWKTWGFMTAFLLGSIVEITGYFGRMILSTNPWDQSGLYIQMVCLIVGPIFYSAGIYLCYSDLVASFKLTGSRIHAKIYPLISGSTTVVPILLQTTGSVIATKAIISGENPNMGSSLIIAGLIFQILSMILFGIMCLEFGVRAHLDRHIIDPSTKGVRSLNRFKFFWVALGYSYVMILIRCVFRVVELSGGFVGSLAKNETMFIALEGVMVLAAGYAMCLVHPGYVFRAKIGSDTECLSDDEKNIM